MKPKRHKPRPAVFLEAARLIGEGKEDYACCAIAMAAGKEREAITSERLYFHTILRPVNTEWIAWYENHNIDGITYDQSRQQAPTARILGLCLCAILAKEGFEP